MLPQTVSDSRPKSVKVSVSMRLVMTPLVRLADLSLGRMAVSITMIVVALAGSAFISAAESALLSARPSLIEHMAADGDRRARAVMSVLERYESFFATILLFGNLFNIIVAVAAGNLLVLAISDGETTILSNILATALATILVYTIGELTPKTIGAVYPESWSLAVAHIVFALIVLARPLVAVFKILPIAVLRIFGISQLPGRTAYTSGELSRIIDESQEDEVFDATHGEMIDNLLSFGQKDLRNHEARWHTSEIIWLKEDDDLNAFMKEYKDHEDEVTNPHHLLPGFIVHSGESKPSGYWYDVDQLAGVVYTKDIMEHIATHAATHGLDFSTPIRDVMGDGPSLPCLPDTTKLDDVLTEMIRSGHEIVVSKNAKGQVNGMVTLKGVLELMRGDEDEIAFGKFEEQLQKSPLPADLPHGTHVVPGALSVEGTRSLTGFDIPLNPRYETIAGFFIEKLQRAPETGSVATHDDQIEMTVEAMDGNQISQLSLRLIDEEASGATSH